VAGRRPSPWCRGSHPAAVRRPRDTRGALPAESTEGTGTEAVSRAPSADAGARLCGPPPSSAVRRTCRRRRRTARPPALVLGSRLPLRAAADPASAACAAVIWAAATCARRCISPPAAGLSSGDIRSYRRSRHFLTRPISRIVMSHLLPLVNSRRFAGLLQRSPGPVRVCAAALATTCSLDFTNRSALWRSSAICAVVQPG
jgi:hypothetical protein